ncbi:MAG TPA: hypothetical protein DEA08_26850 [Planctomycetes bacterium]|nr:hypothetical protein [Planctomycetota bacterium]|tara:strand:+ start:376 stop:597 length:222 start_codon:yes stop_codon:yes gene_type:complete
MKKLEKIDLPAPKRRGRWAKQAAQASAQAAERREHAWGVLGVAGLLLWGVVCWCGRSLVRTGRFLQGLSELTG